MRKPVLFVLCALLAAACADTTTTGSQEPAPEASFPVTVAGVSIEARPQRILSLSATATEILFEIGAGEQVIAVDDQSNHPPEAPTTDLSSFEPNVEAIAGYQPDLVVFSYDVNDLGPGLSAVGIPGLFQPDAKTLDDTYEQIEQLGAATGHPAEAAALVERMKTEIEQIVAMLPPVDEARTYYHELDQTYYSATSSTFIGSVYSLLGLRSIADPADGGGTGYPQLSAEAIIDANPDLIFLADVKCCRQSAETVAQRPGWKQISAVRTGSIIELDDDVASRWGPRVVEFLRQVAEAVRALETAA